MADTRAATTSHWKWHLAIVFAIVAAGTTAAQNRFGESVLRTPSKQSSPVRVADSRDSVVVNGEKEDPFADFPRAEIWHGNQRVTPVPKDGSESWTPDKNESYKSVATRMIEDAIRRAESGDMKGALRLARWAKSFPVVWKKGEHSPEWLMTELPLIEKRRHNGELEQNQLRNAELANQTPLPPTYSEPDPLTKRKSAELEERMIVLEDALEKDQEIEPVRPVDAPTTTTNESDSAQSTVMAYLASFAGGALFTLIVVSALVLVVFRKNSSRSGPVFRVELVNNAQGETVLVPARNSNDARRSEDGESPAHEFADPPPLEDIPLEISGPTYDEEIKRREQERVAREQAMLQFVYEKNVELRDELDDYERAA